MGVVDPNMGGANGDGHRSGSLPNAARFRRGGAIWEIAAVTLVVLAIFALGVASIAVAYCSARSKICRGLFPETSAGKLFTEPAGHGGAAPTAGQRPQHVPPAP